MSTTIQPEDPDYVPIVLAHLFSNYADRWPARDRLAAARCLLSLDPGADVSDLVDEDEDD